jgi:CheY-like chemotaxis protein
MSIGVANLSGEAGTSTTVLLVDDDLEFGKVAADLLADRGYRVVGHAATANEAVALCDRLDPDAVLLDVRLPDANGVTLAKRLRAASDRPSILLTSTDRLAVGPAVVQLCGASGFVPKTELARTDLDVFLRR